MPANRSAMTSSMGAGPQFPGKSRSWEGLAVHRCPRCLMVSRATAILRLPFLATMVNPFTDHT